MRIMLDLESRSTVDLKKVSYPGYAAHETTSVLCIGLRDIDSACPAQVSRPRSGAVFTPNDHCPALVVKAIREGAEIWAHNVGFERSMWYYHLHRRLGWPDVPFSQWRCLMACCCYRAVPAGLDKAIKAMSLPLKKDMEGHRVMLSVARPRKPTQTELNEFYLTNPDYFDQRFDSLGLGRPVSVRELKSGPNAGQLRASVTAEPGIRTTTYDVLRSLSGTWWKEDQESLDKTASYCGVDVDGQVDLLHAVGPLPPQQLKDWQLDQRMNMRGVPLDVRAIQRASEIVQKELDHSSTRLSQLTGGVLTSPSQATAITEYINSLGVPLENLQQDTVMEALKRPGLGHLAEEILTIRAETGKASVKKLPTMLRHVDPDWRARWGLIWHKAATGRYAGSGIQWQNLQRDCLDDKKGEVELFHRLLFHENAPDLFRMFWGLSPIEVIGLALRSMIKAEEGCLLYVSDFAAIEARVLAWLCGNTRHLQIFRGDGKVYEAEAATIFGKPAEEIVKGSDERQIGKVTVLALGYGMGWEKFQTTVKDQTGLTITEKFAAEVVDTYRRENPEVMTFHRALNDTVIRAIETRGTYRLGRLTIACNGRWLCIQLPSGRWLWYSRPAVVRAPVPWDPKARRKQATYWSTDAFTKKWSLTRTYGGKLAENVTQAVAADLLQAACHRVEDEVPGELLITVHDEVVSQIAKHLGYTLEQFNAVMEVVPEWGTGCPIKAETEVRERYGK